MVLVDSKEIIHKEFVLAGHTVLHTVERLREYLRRLRPELSPQKNWLLLHDNALSHTSICTWTFVTKRSALRSTRLSWPPTTLLCTPPF
jgi:hypothetical protein